ncbi:hypothetical protein FRC16_010210 [Serendipita sp. 398]|nr:hypothetical protein FRC16_010210 [Serendipita sp. 398]
MSFASDPLDTLNRAPLSKEILRALVEGAEESLVVVVPWCNARADTPKMQTAISTVVGHCMGYIQAIDKSIRMAEDCYIISKEAIDLCKLLGAPDKASREELQGFIDDMKVRANKAVENCDVTVGMFTVVDTGLLEEGPKVALALKGGEKSIFVRFQHAATAIDSKSVDIDLAMKQLHLPALEVAKLSGNVNNFVKWWSDMETNLKTASEKASGLVPDKRRQYRMKQIKEIWTEIMNDYRSYKAEMVKLQCFYLPGILASVPRLWDELNEATPAQVNIKSITKGAKKCLLILAPWNAAQTELQKVIATIVGYCTIYIRAIDTSIEAADDGVATIREVLRLLATDNTLALQRLQMKAATALKSCQHTMEIFNAVQTGLNEMTRTIPKDAIDVKGNINSKFIQLYNAVAKNAAPNTMEIKVAMKEQNLKTLKVTKLSENVDDFIAWWSQMNTNIENMAKELPCINETSEDFVKNQCVEISNEYRDYKAEIAKFKGYYLLNKTIPAKENLRALTKGAEDSLLILAPWHAAQTELQKVVMTIVNHCTVYVQAINASIKMADDGYTMSEDTLEICEFLLEPSTNQKQLERFVDYMQTRTENAFENCQGILRSLEAVIKSLNEMIATIPKEALDAREDDRVSQSPPFGTPSLNVVLESMEVGVEMKEKTLVPLNMATLSESVDDLVAWWTRMGANSEIAVGKLFQLDPEQISQTLVKLIRKKWIEIRDEYADYKTEMGKLRNLYPPGIKLPPAEVDPE